MPMFRISRGESDINPSAAARRDAARKAFARLMRIGLAAFLLLAGCLDGGGSGSETTVSGITGRVVDAHGNPVEGAAIRVRPEGAVPPGLLGLGGNGAEAPAAFTKADGTFLIQKLTAGDYYVECRVSAGAALLQASVKDTLVRLPDAVVRPTGAVRGRLPTDVTAMDLGLSGVFAYIPGLPGSVFAGVTENRDTLKFVLGDIPAGIYAVRVNPGYDNDLARYKILDFPDVRIEPGDTTDLGSFRLPPRAGTQDPAYLRDSTAFAAVLRANGLDEKSVAEYTGVSGDRITMLVEYGGRFTRFTPDLEALDQVEFVNFMGDPSTGAHDLDASGIERLGRLRTLQLWAYHLVGDPGWMGGLRKLEILSLGSTGLKSFPVAIEDLPFLHTLNLYGDSIGLLPGTVKKMQSLRSLSLDKTGLDSLPPEMGEMPGLSGVGLGQNRFTSFPTVLLRLDSLRTLDMRDNQLTALPRELMAMSSLRGLNVRGNRLCGLSREWKDWLKDQDSLWYSESDTSLYKWPKGTLDSGWEAGQHCTGP